jgi:hypothetical protein
MEIQQIENIMDSIFELECKLAKNKTVHDYKIQKEPVVTKTCDNMMRIGYIFFIKISLLEMDSTFEEIKENALKIADMILKKRLYTNIHIDMKDFMSNRSLYFQEICV